jgi:nitroimidazol reductase NimA-like FMN-containing flavoprotein (pyridoxamine 5'-phosphate oxidase superfamily)
MSELAMSREEREQFLAALHVGVLAIDRPDRPPLVTPMWYRYAPGGVVEFNTASSSEKAKLLEQTGHASLCAQREELPYAYVTVDGPVEIAPTDRATRVDIATRYLGLEVGTAYIDSSPDADDLVILLHPARWRTADFSKLDTAGG